MSSKSTYFKINLGLLLTNSEYFSQIKAIIRGRDDSRIQSFKRENINNLACDTCNGYGYTAPSGKPLNLAKSVIDKIVKKTAANIREAVGSRGKRAVSVPDIKVNSTVLSEIRSNLKKIVEAKPNTIVDFENKDMERLLRKVTKAKKCPTCSGYGIKVVDHSPSIAERMYIIAIRYAERFILKDKDVNLYSITLPIKSFSEATLNGTKLYLIDWAVNSRKGAKEGARTKIYRDYVTKQFSKNLRFDEDTRKKTKKYSDISKALAARDLDERFLKWVLQRLRKTIRIDTKTSYNKLKGRIIYSADKPSEKEKGFRLYITSALVRDKPNTSSNSNIMYMKFYSDWSRSVRNDWSDEHRVKSVKRYLRQGIQQEFLKMYNIEDLVDGMKDTVITKKLMNLIILFGESYGGK